MHYRQIGRWFRCATVLLVLLLGGSIPWAAAGRTAPVYATDPAQPGTRLVQAGPADMVSEWTLPPFSMGQVVLDGSLLLLQGRG